MAFPPLLLLLLAFQLEKISLKVYFHNAKVQSCAPSNFCSSKRLLKPWFYNNTWFSEFDGAKMRRNPIHILLFKLLIVSWCSKISDGKNIRSSVLSYAQLAMIFFRISWQPYIPYVVCALRSSLNYYNFL